MPTTHRHIPYTGDSSDYEVSISADNALPTALSDANVDFRNVSPRIGPRARAPGTRATAWP